MRRTPNPVLDRVAGWLDGSNPRATRRAGWAAVAALAVALVWPLSGSDGDARAGVGGGADPAGAQAPPRSAVEPRPEPSCPPGAAPADPHPPELVRVSPSRVGTGGVVESTRWGMEGRHGLWGVAAVAVCEGVRLDAVWFGPNGQKQRHRISGPGQVATGVIANGLDGAISVYSVRPSTGGGLSALLHISTDWGRTWQEREVPASAEPDIRAGLLSAQWQRWRVLDG